MNPFKQACSDSGKKKLPFNRKKPPAEGGAKLHQDFKYWTKQLKQKETELDSQHVTPIEEIRNVKRLNVLIHPGTQL